jgi:hypothetical protein
MPLCRIVVSSSMASSSDGAGPLPSPPAFVDVEGHAFAAYGATPGTVVDIRPDGYVAAIRAAS